MAKHAGSEGERSNAKRIIERACTELGISVADAMAGNFGKHENKPFVSFTGFNVYTTYTNNSGFYYRSAASTTTHDDIKKTANEMANMFRKQAEEMQKAQDDLRSAEARRKAAVAEMMRKAGR